MAIDNKYGNVTLERGDIGDDEPVFIFRGRDIFLPDVIEYYRSKCVEKGASPEHVTKVSESLQQINVWQQNNLDQVHVPS